MSNTKYPRHFMPDDYSLPTIEESKKYRGIFDKIYVEHEAISPHFPEALILLPRKGGYRIAPGSVPWLNGAKNDLLIDFFSDKNRK